MDLLTLLTVCTVTSASPSPDLMYLVVFETSKAREWYVEDATAERAYTPATRTKATALATALTKQGHEVHVGLAGVRTDLLPAYGVTLHQAFDPCTNLKVASAAIEAEWESCGGAACALRRYWSTRHRSAGRGWAVHVQARKRIDVDRALDDPSYSVPNPEFSSSSSLLIDGSAPEVPRGGGVLVEPRTPDATSAPDGPGASTSSKPQSFSSSDSSSDEDSSESSSSSKRPPRDGAPRRAQPDVTDETLKLHDSSSSD